MLGTTFGGKSIGMRFQHLAVLEAIEDLLTTSNAKNMGDYLLENLKKI
jgi:acetylornithine/succinyldiaminopimelate/putrescine aminotransferase